MVKPDTISDETIFKIIFDDQNADIFTDRPIINIYIYSSSFFFFFFFFSFFLGGGGCVCIRITLSSSNIRCFNYRPYVSHAKHMKLYKSNITN